MDERSGIRTLFDSIYFPSGQPSLKMVRELLQLLPTAVSIIDADDGSILAMSPEAEKLNGTSLEQYVNVLQHQPDQDHWLESVKRAEAQPGKVLKVAGQIRTARGELRPVVGSFTMGKMADRRVLITVLEPGMPIPELAVG